MLFKYKRNLYPDYLKFGGACKFIEHTARQFCHGKGIDVGCGSWPLEGAQGFDIKPHDAAKSGEACDLKVPNESQDYVFSSHCLEHLDDPIKALEHWVSKIRPGGVLFLYLPHPDMEYWLPQNCRKHRHAWNPQDMAKVLEDIGLQNVIHSGRDMYWSFTVVGFKQATDPMYL